MKWLIALLTAATGILHLLVGFDIVGGFGAINWMLVLNGVGYLVLLLLFLGASGSRRGTIRWILLAYTLITLIGYFVINGISEGFANTFGLLIKGIELLLIILLFLYRSSERQVAPAASRAGTTAGTMASRAGTTVNTMASRAATGTSSAVAATGAAATGAAAATMAYGERAADRVEAAVDSNASSAEAAYDMPAYRAGEFAATGMGAIDEGLAGAGDWAGDAVDETGDAMAGAGNALGDMASGAADTAEEGMAAASDWAGDAVDETGDAVAGAGDALGDMASGAADTAGEGMAAASDWAGDAVDETGDAMAGAGDALGDMASGAADTAGEGMAAASDWAGDAVDETGDAMAGAGDALGDMASGAADTAGEGMAAASDWAGDAVDETGDAMAGAGDALGDMASGAADTTGRAFDAAGDAGSGAVDAAGAALGGMAVGAASATVDATSQSAAREPDMAATVHEPTAAELRAELEEYLHSFGGRSEFRKEVEYVEGIGPAMGAKLRAVGVATVLDLLVEGATRRGRKHLSDRSGIAQSQILTWVNHIDLYRLKGVAQEYADLLEQSGVDTVVELAQRNPNNLFKRMNEINDQKKLVRRTPHLSEVQSWVEQARSLKRLIHY